jgi:hypothetical protein
MSKYSVTFVFVSISIVFSQLLLHIYVKIIYFPVNYGVVLLLGVESLMVGSTTGVPMCPGYGGYRSTTLLSYYSTLTNAAPAYFTKAPKYYTTKLQSITNCIKGEKRRNNQASDYLRHDNNCRALFVTNCILHRT